MAEDLPFPAAALEALAAEYGAEVAFMDSELGRVLEALRRRELYDPALIVVVADHGELLGEQRLLGHGGRLDPELIEVPLIIKWPHQRQAKRVSDLVSVVDLYPTLLAAAGLAPGSVDGLALSPKAAPGRELAFCEEHAMGIHQPIGRMRIADRVYGVEWRDRRELLWSGGRECFRRAAGGWAPADCPESSAMELVRAFLPPAGAAAGQAITDLDEEELERLRVLGYAQ
jgi:arylsulfatase A-like enzyme